MEPLCDKGLAALNVRFIVPLAVQRMLAGDEELDDIAEYTIQDIFGELPPDAALLGLALCAQHIGSHVHDLAIGRVLTVEAEKIIDEYGPVWLAHEAGQITMANAALVRLLANVPEDLECLSDLLLATCQTLAEEERAIPAILCDILGDMADLQHAYAEAEMEALDRENEQCAELVMAAGANVIPFPRRA